MNVSETAVDATNQRKRIQYLYNSMMEQIIARTDAIMESIIEVRENANSSLNWKNAEFCYLQIRKICEYIALAVLVAHDGYNEFSSKKFLKEWSAGSLLSNLVKLNANAFPISFSALTDVYGFNQGHAFLDGGMTANDLKVMYDACGSRLHVGSLKSIFAGKLPSYDLDEIGKWRDQLVGLLSSHVIVLPELKSVLLVHLKYGPDEKVFCVFGDSGELSSEDSGEIDQSLFVNRKL